LLWWFLNFFKGDMMKKLYSVFRVLAALLTFTSTAFAEIGSASSDLVFTPVTPCRLFDTRTTSGGTGPIPGGSAKDFAVWGTASFAAQGGAATNCGITAGADTASIAVNMTVVLPAAGGYITAYPTGVLRPLAAALNFNAGDVRGNMVIVKVAQTGATNLSVYSTSTTELVGDVVGYYSQPVATALECFIVNGTVTVVPAFSVGINVLPPSCPANAFKTASYCATFSFDTVLMGFNSAACNFKNPSAVSTSVRHDINCCRIPGR
jgi:hypothetical protein